ncbi:MAG TPA: hypothetical protein VFO16_15865 [Pseudonocardiaceae bacterium]|nr:hypothetical protein [Pseudonocardiaceae bacterium]
MARSRSALSREAETRTFHPLRRKLGISRATDTSVLQFTRRPALGHHSRTEFEVQRLLADVGCRV